MTPSATAISTLFEKQQRQQEMRTEVVPLDIDDKGMGGITALDLQRIGSRKCYCAIFQTDGNVVYGGEGVGLDGEHLGELSRDDRMRLHRLMRLLHQSDMASLADSYLINGDIIGDEGALFLGWLLVERGKERQVIESDELAAPPIFSVVTEFLDLLLDRVVWEDGPFSLDRAAIPPLEGKRKRRAR